ncbi:hypothetical protein BKA83DRAFT_4495900 [Pisolithus microcarpus]|nr:hypothetical protein BKA83DRAFT_4495900 [Pisolithus microcarpus]
MPSKVPEDGSRGWLLKVDGCCEASFKHKEVTSYISGKSLTVDLQRDCLQEETEEQNEEELLGTKPSVELEATEAMGDSPVPHSKYPCSPSSPCTDFPPQNPLNEP